MRRAGGGNCGLLVCVEIRACAAENLPEEKSCGGSTVTGLKKCGVRRTVHLFLSCAADCRIRVPFRTRRTRLSALHFIGCNPRRAQTNV